MPTIDVSLSARGVLLVSPPGYPRKVASLIEMNIEAPFPCRLNGLANPSGQVSIRSSQ